MKRQRGGRVSKKKKGDKEKRIEGEEKRDDKKEGKYTKRE